MKIKDYIKFSLLGILIVIAAWLLLAPCSVRPLSKHSCECEGFKEGYGATKITQSMIYEYGIDCHAKHPIR